MRTAEEVKEDIDRVTVIMNTCRDNFYRSCELLEDLNTELIALTCPFRVGQTFVHRYLDGADRTVREIVVENGHWVLKTDGPDIKEHDLSGEWGSAWEISSIECP